MPNIQASSRSGDRFIHYLPWVCYAVPVLVVIFDLLVILLNPGFSPLDKTISEFVLRNYGWIERTGLSLMGTALLVLGIVWFWYLGGKTDRLFHFAGLVLVPLGLCFLVIAIFKVDGSKREHTLHGAIHRVVTAIIAFGFPFFCLIVAWCLRNKHSLRLFALYSAFTCLMGLLNVGWGIFAFASGQLPGLSERILTLINLIWLAIAGVQITRLTSGQVDKANGL